MTLTVPPGRPPIPIEAKDSGGFQALGLGSAPTGAQRVISGTGFGSGPNVVLFDRVEGTEGSIFDLAGADIGSWGSFANETQPKYVSAHGRTWMPARDPDLVSVDQQAKAMTIWDAPAGFKEFFISYRLRNHPDYIFPGAATKDSTSFSLNDVGNSSFAKLVWLTTPNNEEELPDIVIPTFSVNGLAIVGNTNSPKTASGSGLYYPNNSQGGYFDLTDDTLFSYYQSGDESVEGAEDAIFELLRVDARQATFNMEVGDPYVEGAVGTGLQTKDYVSLFWAAYLDGYRTQHGSNVNIQALGADFYVALGDGNPGSPRAKIMTTDAPVFSNSRKCYIIPPDRDAQGNSLWSDTEIRFTPRVHEDLPYVHIMLADGTLIENAEGV